MNQTTGQMDHLVNLNLNVENKGLSDQILKDFDIVLKSPSKESDHVVKIHGLKARSH